MNAFVISACYSQHNGVTESTEYSADHSEEAQSLRKKKKIMFSQTAQTALKAPGNGL